MAGVLLFLSLAVPPLTPHPTPPPPHTPHPTPPHTPPLTAGPTLDSVFLVFEYCPHDMGRLVDAMRQPFHESEVKCLMQQVGALQGAAGGRGGSKSVMVLEVLGH